MPDLYHVLLDLGTGDYHFPAIEYQCLLNIRGRLSYLIPGN